jgi:hypothetical protein
MLNIIKEIEKKFKLYKTGGASSELISEAEKQLDLKFADDYKEYLSNFGAISFGSTELTGLNIDSYANVVTVTLQENQRSNSFPQKSIVLENIGIEGILVLQKENGQIYEWNSEKETLIFPNLTEFLKSKINN